MALRLLQQARFASLGAEADSGIRLDDQSWSAGRTSVASCHYYRAAAASLRHLHLRQLGKMITFANHSIEGTGAQRLAWPTDSRLSWVSMRDWLCFPIAGA